MDFSDSDDGGLKHITMLRARPPKRRLASAQREQVERARLGGGGADADDSSDEESQLGRSRGSSAAASAAAAPRFAKNELVEYRRPRDVQGYEAVVVSVDCSVAPASYVVRFSDGSERVTEEGYLQPCGGAPPPPPSEASVQGGAEGAQPASAAVAQVHADPEPAAQPAPAPAAELDPSAAAVPGKKKEKEKEKRRKDEGSPDRRSERRREREAQQQSRRRSSVATSGAAAEDDSSRAGEPQAALPSPAQAAPPQQPQQQQEPQPAEGAKPPSVRCVKNLHPSIARLLPGTKIYAALMVDKISNRGFRCKRVMVVTSLYVVFAKEEGEIRKWFEVTDLAAAVCEAQAGGGARVLLRLADGCPEPDAIVASRDRPDPRNTHASLAEVLEVVQAIQRVRQAMARRKGEAVHPIAAVRAANGADLKALARKDVEKPGARQRKQQLAALGASGKSPQQLAMASQADEVESEPEEVKKAAEKLPKWKPDTEATHCDECAKQFTFMRRRHHCRACGGVFCNGCTPNRAKIAALGEEPVRVCGGCTTRLAESLA